MSDDRVTGNGVGQLKGVSSPLQERSQTLTEQQLSYLVDPELEVPKLQNLRIG